jgi:hypothetical protein
VVLAVAPLLLPVAAFSPNFLFITSQPYPLAFALFDALGLVLLYVILRFWTSPLFLAVWRKLNGAPAKDVAGPFIKILGRAGNLATWASNR